MEIKAYYNYSDDRQVNKDIREEELFEGELREDSDIMSPAIRFYSSDILRFNYFYIPDWRRYYNVSSITAVSNEIYDVQMDEDVLMSFRGDIANLNAVVAKQSDTDNGDEYIDDSSLVTDNLLFVRTYNFPNGFNEDPSFILITAG